jgi:hypothetical protein
VLSQVLIPQGSILSEDTDTLQLCIDGVAAVTSNGVPIPYIAGGEGSDDDDDDDDDNDDDDDDDASGSGGNSDGSKSGKDDDKSSQDGKDDSGLKSALEKERDRRRRMRRERDDARGELDKLKNKDLPELEQVKSERDTAVRERDELRSVHTQAKVELAFLKANSGIVWHDPEDALVHVRKELADALEDDDEIDSEVVKRIATDLARRKPYLVKSQGDDKGGKKDDKKDEKGGSNSDGSSEGSSAGGGKGTRGSKDASRFSKEKLRESYPALRK